MTAAKTSKIFLIALLGLVFAPSAFAAYEISDGSVKELWHLSDTVDASGNGHTLINTGGTFTTGKLGNGVSLNGSSQYLNTTITNIGSGDFTITYWVKHNSFFNYIGHLSTTRGTTGFNAGTQAVAQCVWYTNSTEKIRCGTTTYTSGQWHFVVWKKESGTLKVFVDNVEKGSASDAITYSSTNFDLGSSLANDNSHSEFLNGILDEVVIANRAFSTGEISALYNAGAGQEICTTASCAATTTTSTSTATTTEEQNNFYSLATYVLYLVVGLYSFRFGFRMSHI